MAVIEGIEDRRAHVVRSFRSLEVQLIQFMEYIPYSESNKSVGSPKLVPLLMDTCSLIEAVLRHAAGKDQRYNFKAYAESVEHRLGLEDATSLLLVSPLKLLRPFRGWTKEVPAWWEAYNRLKHDRLVH